MTIKDNIIRLIKHHTHVLNPITETSNLYTDLGLDSLSFITLLANIEEIYSITFDIAEMDFCLQIGNLISTTKNKIKEQNK